MNHERQIRDIYIKSGSEWIPINADSGSDVCRQFASAYTQYKNRSAYHREVAFEGHNVTVFRYNNDHYKPTHVSQLNGQNIPIIDMADVKVFLTVVQDANWF